MLFGYYRRRSIFRRSKPTSRGGGRRAAAVDFSARRRCHSKTLRRTALILPSPVEAALDAETFSSSCFLRGSLEKDHAYRDDLFQENQFAPLTD